MIEFPIYVVYETDLDGNVRYVKADSPEGLVCAGMGFDGQDFTLEKEAPKNGIDCTA